jgi:PTS system fructose-specific IIC component
MVSRVQSRPAWRYLAALIPGAVTNLLAYGIAIVAGTVVTAAALFFLKRPITEPMPALA